MALGGGIWMTQNKKLPGAYINFVSAAAASGEISDRGVAAMGLSLDWGASGEMLTVTAEDFAKRSEEIFGYPYSHEKLKGLRDLFRNARTLYAYRVNAEGSVKAENGIARAVCAGARGNDIRIVIGKNGEMWDVATYLDGARRDIQTVAAAAELKANGLVEFKAFEPAENAGAPLTGGVTGTATIGEHQRFLERLESYAVNAVGAVADGETEVNALYSAYARRMRDQEGVKLQVVLFGCAADHEGIINVKNPVTDEGWGEDALVYWATGLAAGAAVNESALNRPYDGEFSVFCEYTQAQLEAAIDAGEFTLHRCGGLIRVLNDQNSLVTLTADKGELFRQNQTVRVIDCIATDVAALFRSKYLGAIPNDENGRVSLWADIVAHHRELMRARAIEDFDEGDVSVTAGAEKGAVVVDDAVTIVNAMAKLYMTCVIQ